MTKRSYQQNCALALSADVIGERWSLLLVRDLLVGPRRFRDLLLSLHGIGTNLLTTRLRELQSEDIIERRPLLSGGHAYVLTDKGNALRPVISALIRWNLQFGQQNRSEYHHQDEWDLVALQALFHPGLAHGLSARVQYGKEDFRAWMSVADQQAAIGLGEIDVPDIVINGTIKELFIESASPQLLCTAGPAKLLRQYMAAFALQSDAT